MPKRAYVYEVRFKDKPAKQGVTFFDPEKGFGEHRTLGSLLLANYEGAIETTTKRVPEGVAVSFPILFD